MKPFLYLRSAFFILSSAAVALGQTPRPSEPPTIEAGFEQRVRTEDWNNILDYTNKLDDEREQIRYRTRAWIKAPLGRNIEFAFGMEQETNQKLGKDNAFDEIVVETAYLDFKKLFTKGLSLKVGRQNLFRGEGFLFFDGTPGDGSRNVYFNAAVLGYEFKKSRIEAIGILNPKFDRMMPKINSVNKPLQDWDDQAVGLYYTDHNRKNTSIEAYYFYKKEVKDYLAPTNPLFQPDRHVSTAGARAVQTLDKHWSVTGELSEQWGAQHGGRDIRAWGGYGYVKRTFEAKSQPYVQAGYWAFSGGDPKSKTIGDFDPLFSRFPKWSELYIYSQVKEHGVGYWTNTGMWQAEAAFKPTSHANWRFTYYKLNAFYPFQGDSRTFSTGLNRGSLFESRLDYTFDKHWKAHALYEGIAPGSFYSAKSYAYFVRFETSYTFTGHIPEPKSWR